MSDGNSPAEGNLERGWTSWAAFGCLYWLGYGVVETFFLAVLPRWTLGDATIGASQPIAAATFLALYGLLGAATGGFSSFLPRVLRSSVVLLSLPGLWAANLLLHWYFDPLIYLPALVALAGVLSLLGTMLGGRGGLAAPLRTGIGLAVPLIGVVALADALAVESVAIRAILAVMGVAVAVALSRQQEQRSEPSRHLVLRACGTFVVSVAAAFALGLLKPPAPLDANTSGSPSPGRPNVVLVSWDTVRSDFLSLYGYPAPTSPFLEELATEATVFRRAYAPSNMTLSSHASLFTGLYPTAHGAHYHHPEFPNGAPLAASTQTLAEELSSLGYSTYGIAANNAYVTPDFGLDQGFAHFDSRAPVVPLAKVHKIYLRRLFRDLLVAAWPRLPLVPRSSFDRLYRTADEIHEASVAALDRAEQTSRSFFLFLNLMDAHDPYIPPAPFDSLVPGFDKGFHSGRFHRVAEQILMHREPIDPADRKHMESQYAGGIAYLDSVLGRLIRELKERGLYENTLLIVTSDHGEVFGDGLLFGHAVSLLRDQIHVPLVVRYPGQLEAESVDSVVSLVDIMPTVLMAVGGVIPSGLHGRPLQDPSSNREVFAEHFRPGHSLSWGDWFGGSQTSVLVDDRKLIVHHAGGRIELLGLDEDGTELPISDPPEMVRLRDRLELWRQALDVAKVGEGVVDEETLKRLKALGYV